MKNFRVQRVADLITQEISMIIRTKTSDKRFSMATVTGSKVSRDLKIAHVYISVLGAPSMVDEVMSGLKDAQGFFRREIGRTLKLRFTPEIRFVYDDSLLRGQRILDELAQIDDEDDESDDPGSDSEA